MEVQCQENLNQTQQNTHQPKHNLTWDYLIKNQQLETNMWINIIMISKDCKFIICAGITRIEGFLRVFDPLTGQQVWSDCNGHSYIITSIDISADNRRIVSGSNDNTARIWNINTGEQIGSPYQYKHRIKSVCFSPDYQYIASISQDGFAQIWSIENQSLINKCLINISDYYKCVIGYLSETMLLISSCQLHSIRLWNTQTGSLKQIYKNRSRVNSITYSPNRKLIAFNLKSNIYIQDPKTMKQIAKQKLTCLYDNFQFAPDLATILFQQNLVPIHAEDDIIPIIIQVWDIRNRTLKFLEHREDYVSSLQYTPNGRYYLFGSASQLTLKLIQ